MVESLLCKAEAFGASCASKAPGEAHDPHVHSGHLITTGSRCSLDHLAYPSVRAEEPVFMDYYWPSGELAE